MYSRTSVSTSAVKGVMAAGKTSLAGADTFAGSSDQLSILPDGKMKASPVLPVSPVLLVPPVLFSALLVVAPVALPAVPGTGGGWRRMTWLVRPCWWVEHIGGGGQQRCRMLYVVFLDRAERRAHLPSTLLSACGLRGRGGEETLVSGPGAEARRSESPQRALGSRQAPGLFLFEYLLPNCWTCVRGGG